MNTASHVPVLLERVLDLFAPSFERANPVVVDTTLGLGGHTEALLERFPGLHVIGIDRDPEALKRAQARLAPFQGRVTFAHAVYDEIGDVLASVGRRSVAGVLFDLGVSSMQLDVADRGFAYSQNAPLDMRMNPEDGLTAADVLNTYDEADISRLLHVYGEERFARRIAKAIVAERQREPFRDSGRLAELVRQNIPAAARRTGGNPAKRTFQALRIEVNDELRVYERALPAALEAIELGGRVIVLSYHSLEDRITKRAFAKVTDLNVPRGLPVIPEGSAPRFKAIVRGSEQASDEETVNNPRARSVRLRAVERIAL